MSEPKGENKKPIPVLEVTPVHKNIVHLIPFKPVRRRKKGVKEEVLQSKWGRVVVYTRETLNSFDLKVFSAFSYLFVEKLRSGEVYSAGKKIFQWKDGDRLRERTVRLSGVYTSQYHFLKDCMHITVSSTTASAVWESLLRFEGTTWVFYPSKSISAITAKIVHGVQQNDSGGWTILASESYLKSLEKVKDVLSISNYILQNIKNDTAVVLSCWLQGQSGNTFFVDTIVDSIHLKRDRNVIPKLKKAFDELKNVGQITYYSIERDALLKTWKVIIERNKELTQKLKFFAIPSHSSESNGL